MSSMNPICAVVYIPDSDLCMLLSERTALRDAQWNETSFWGNNSSRTGHFSVPILLPVVMIANPGVLSCILTTFFVHVSVRCVRVSFEMLLLMMFSAPWHVTRICSQDESVSQKFYRRQLFYLHSQRVWLHTWHLHPYYCRQILSLSSILLSTNPGGDRICRQ